MLSLLAFTIGCNQTQKKTDATKERTFVNDTIPMERTQVNPQPVATYSAPVPDEYNKFEFTVKLYETPLRFRYRVDVTYKMMDVTDSVDIPNFGHQPKVDVRKHENELSSMIGFYDAKGEFMDLKKVEIVDNQLRIRQVKHYGLRAVRKQ
ncbi:hypothetical protein [Telluribacter sp. SYSU D00476]|uniref:hypothetical protein n=1 Tax=Telluribacter sp. SYSU D00476 TaxID=2811430 RepID=UPI001FF34F75|nr:hypothetical protein [Telluribacter sp. SYSU D00476]